MFFSADYTIQSMLHFSMSIHDTEYNSELQTLSLRLEVDRPSQFSSTQDMVLEEFLVRQETYVSPAQQYCNLIT